MEEGIIRLGDGSTAIINGGNPLPGCPESWEEAYRLEEQLNNGKSIEDIEGPVWDFDCGFKLDYDGPLLSVSSRFYPPKTHYGGTWDGTVTVFLCGNGIAEKKFDCPTVNQLKAEVEGYIKSITGKIEAAFK